MLSKSDISKRLTKTNLLTIKESTKIVDEIFDMIKESVENDIDVSIVGFGKFFLYEHNPRPVRNPKTLEPMTLVPYKSLKFKPSEKLKRILKNRWYLDAYLVLGCNGYIDKCNIIHCNSVSNAIIDLSCIEKENQKQIFEFLENGCNLFDKICYDPNMVGNIINLLYRKYSVISESKLPSIQFFLKMHKTCGIYLAIVLKEDYDARRG